MAGIFIIELIQFSKTYAKLFDKVLHCAKMFLLKMFLFDLIFVVSHIKIHPAVHLSTSNSCYKKNNDGYQ